MNYISLFLVVILLRQVESYSTGSPICPPSSPVPGHSPTGGGNLASNAGTTFALTIKSNGVAVTSYTPGQTLTVTLSSTVTAPYLGFFISGYDASIGNRLGTFSNLDVGSTQFVAACNSNAAITHSTGFPKTSTVATWTVPLTGVPSKLMFNATVVTSPNLPYNIIQSQVLFALQSTAGNSTFPIPSNSTGGGGSPTGTGNSITTAPTGTGVSITTAPTGSQNTSTKTTPISTTTGTNGGGGWTGVFPTEPTGSQSTGTKSTTTPGYQNQYFIVGTIAIPLGGSPDSSWRGGQLSISNNFAVSFQLPANIYTFSIIQTNGNNFFSALQLLPCGNNEPNCFAGIRTLNMDNSGNATISLVNGNVFVNIMANAAKCQPNDCGENGICNPSVGCACYPFFSGNKCEKTTRSFNYGIIVNGLANFVAGSSLVNPLSLTLFDLQAEAPVFFTSLRNVTFSPPLPPGFSYDSIQQTINGQSNTAQIYNAMVSATIGSSMDNGLASVLASFGSLTISGNFTINVLANVCNTFSCGSGGVCRVTYQGTPSCACNFGFSGQTCNMTVDLCSNVQCGNFGSCVYGQCVCKNGYVGVTCSTPPTSASTSFTFSQAHLNLIQGVPMASISPSLVNTALSLSATGVFSFSISQGTLPTGISIDTKTGIVSGTPTAIGNFNIVVSASLLGVQFTTTVQISVSAPQPPTSVQSAYFSSTGNSILINFNGSNFMANYDDCSIVFANSHVLGTGSSCNWISPSTLKVTLGSASVIATTSSAQVTDCSTTSTTSLILNANVVIPFQGSSASTPSSCLQISTPLSGAPPVQINMFVPSSISCEDLHLDASSFTGGGGKNGNFIWSISGIDGFNASLVVLTSSKLIVPASMIPNNSNFNVSLSISNFLGAVTSSTFAISKSINSAPVVQIPGGDVTTDVNQDLSLFANVALQGCNGPQSSGGVVTTWSCTTGCGTLSFVNQSKNPAQLVVKANTLAVGGTYVFTVTSTIGGTSSTASVTVSVNTPPLTASFSNLPATVGLANSSFSLGLRSSHDEIPSLRSNLTYQWSCSITSSSGPSYACSTAASSFFAGLKTPNVNFNSSVLPANLPGEAYTIFANIMSSTSGISSSTSTATFVVSPLSLPMVSIFGKNVINPQDKLVLTSNVRTSQSGSISYLWTVTQGVVSTASFATSNTLQYLVISGGSLSAGASYTFRCTAFDGVASNYVEFNITVNAPPSGGYLTQPTTVSANTAGVTAMNWDSENSPLSYAFGYLSLTGDVIQITSFKTNAASSNIILPPGTWNLTVIVQDSVGGRTVSSTDSLGNTVQFTVATPTTLPTAASITSNFTAQLQLGNIDGALGTLHSQASQFIDLCSGVNCGTNGLCSKGMCTCTNSYTGLFCQTPPIGVTPSPMPCLNGCSSNGDCIRYPINCTSVDLFCSVKCSCKLGHYGLDCSVDQATYNSTVSSIGAILGAVSSATSIMSSTSSDSLNQQGDLLSAAASAGAQFFSSSQAGQLFNLTSNIVNAANGLSTVSPTLGAQVVSVIGSLYANDQANTAVTATSSRRRMSASSSDVTNNARAALIHNISLAVGSSLLPGESSIGLTTPTIQVGIFASLPGTIGAGFNTTGNLNGTFIRLPGDFLNDVVNKTNAIHVHSITHTNDIHSTLAGISANLTRLDVFNPLTNRTICVHNITNPVNITISHSAKTPKCAYWNETAQAYASDGVTTITLSNNQVICQTNHFTDFTVINDNAASNNAVTPSTGSSPSTGGNSNTGASPSTGGGGGSNTPTTGGNGVVPPQASPASSSNVAVYAGAGVVVMLIVVGAFYFVSRQRKTSSLAMRKSKGETEMGSSYGDNNTWIGSQSTDHVVINPLN